MFKSKQRISLNCKDSSITSTLLITLSHKFMTRLFFSRENKIFNLYLIEKYAKWK